MKQILIALLIVITAITLIISAFTFNQTNQEKQRMISDLEYRSTLLADSLKESVEPNFINKSGPQLQNLVYRFENQERFAAMAIYDNKGNTIATSSALLKPSLIKKVAEDAMDADKPSGDFVQLNNEKTYVLAIPLHDENEKSVVGALLIAQNAGYIDSRINEIWQNNLIRLFLQVSLVSIAIIIVIRWIIYEPIRRLVTALKLARTEGLDQNSPTLPNSPFFKPLIKEILNTRRSLIEARLAASEEAKLRLEKLDSPWTEQRLKVFVKDVLKGRPIFVVSNREPYVHTKEGRNVNYHIPASGMVTAIEPMMEACQGMWIAWGSGDADKLTVDENDTLRVPPDEPQYTLKRVWLTEKEEDGHYGFSNDALWPLCHTAYTRPTFKKEDWEEYKKVNGKFAQVILSEIKNHDRPIVFIQDFHLALVPRMIKDSRPDASVGIFWHIPWPNPESFSVCPWKKDIVDGMLGADLIGFHTQLHCNNFVETVGKELESLIDFEQSTVQRGEHISYVKPFPISLAFPNPSKGKVDYPALKKLLKDLGIKTDYIGVGIDRLDYTKGILERFKAIEIFLSRYPQYVGKFTFIQIASPSRSKIKQYQKFAGDVDKEVERINNLYKKNGWKPIIFLKKHHSHDQVNEFYRIANVCLVTSLHDGMNLVAKEFVAARDDEKGVLILSQFTGAARELKDALIINPYNGEQTAEAIKIALELPPSEQTKRMKKLREVIKNHNVYLWSAEILKAIVNPG